MAKLMPNACVICHEPVGKADYHQITLRDFQGQGLGAEDDATLDNVPMCKLCLAMVLGATSAVLTERQRRS